MDGGFTPAGLVGNWLAGKLRRPRVERCKAADFRGGVSARRRSAAALRQHSQRRAGDLQLWHPEQKGRYLEPLLKGDEFWCQGFSEPNAGSDLSALRTRAVLDGDHYFVSGQKIWTSDAHEADFMFALVRTGSLVPQQEGISFLLIDMKSPGVRVRPITLLDRSHVVSEIFLDTVAVPVANRVGAEGEGWAIAKFLLANERAFSAEVPSTKHDLKRLIELAEESASRFWRALGRPAVPRGCRATPGRSRCP